MTYLIQSQIIEYLEEVADRFDDGALVCRSFFRQIEFTASLA